MLALSVLGDLFPTTNKVLASIARRAASQVLAVLTVRYALQGSTHQRNRALAQRAVLVRYLQLAAAIARLANQGIAAMVKGRIANLALTAPILLKEAAVAIYVTAVLFAQPSRGS